MNEKLKQRLVALTQDKIEPDPNTVTIADLSDLTGFNTESIRKLIQRMGIKAVGERVAQGKATRFFSEEDAKAIITTLVQRSYRRLP